LRASIDTTPKRRTLWPIRTSTPSRSWRLCKRVPQPEPDWVAIGNMADRLSEIARESREKE
jgi:hypothetical protein